MVHLVAALLLAQAHVHDPPARTEQPAPKLHGQMIDLAGSKAYVSKPKGAPKGALLVIHEWWGLTDWIEHMADELAGQGYLALAVDLYQGKSTKDPKEAAGLMQAKDEKYGDSLEEAGLEWLKKNAGGAKVGTIGWCMGGGESLKASLNDPRDVSATVIYYGMPVDDVAKLKTLQGPVLGIFAKKDGHITPEVVAKFDQNLTAAGIKHEFHSYDAGHGFANPSSGAYTSDAAKDAWEKTKVFLRANL
ncbi:MAG TPA: dienelactone hydrolase family protein [Myxococcales bacterium]|nr:dienelactone hydrolase family protein [Myxococcales bacterium]